MVVKSKPKNPGKKKVKVLSLKKETVKNLVGAERKRIKGGVLLLSHDTCPAESSRPASASVVHSQNCATVSGVLYTANTCICVSR